MYTYSPFQEAPVWSGWVFLKAHENIIESLARVLIDMKEFQIEYLNAPMSSKPPWFFQDNDEFAGTLIWQIRIGARGYYNHWILRHMIRVMVKLVFGIDPLEAWAYRYAMKIR